MIVDMYSISAKGHLQSKLVVYHNVFALASELGEVICEVLLSFHILTWSDFTRSFFVAQKYKASRKFYLSHQQQN